MAIVAAVNIENALLGFDQRSKFRQDHLRDSLHVPLALEHPREASEICLQPILLSIFLRGVLEIKDHLIDVVFQRGDFALRLDRDRSSEVAFGHRRRYLGDRAHLIGQVGRQPVNVVGQIAPRSGRAGHVCLPAELSFHADLASY